MTQAGDRSIRDLVMARATRRAVMRGAAGVGLGMGMGMGMAPLGGRLAGAQDTGENPFPQVTLPRAEGQTVSFMTIQPHAVTGDILKQRFEELTGATVNLTVVPYDEVQAKATLDVQSGANQIDVLDYWYPTVGALASQGILDDLTDYIEAEKAEILPEDFIPSIYDPYTLVDGKRWGLPYDGDTHVLFYNTEIFEKAGVTKAPETWDEYLAAAKTITEAGLTMEDGKAIYGCALQGFKVPIIIGCSYSNRLAGFGGAFLNADGSPALDSEAAIQAAQAMIDVAPYALPTPLETAFDQALPAFLSGQVAMMEFWTDLGVYAQDPEGSKIVDKWDVVQNPFGGANTKHIAPLDAGFCFAVSANAKNKELARTFCKWATSQQINLDLLLTTGSGIDPTRVSTLESEAYGAFAPKVQKAAAAALSGAFAWPTIPQSPDLMTVLSDELAVMLQGSQDAAATMANIQAEWIRILGS
ncbi:MAG: ABC transporter substrate-binding protein [Chloroflexota bacterium]